MTTPTAATSSLLDAAASSAIPRTINRRVGVVVATRIHLGKSKSPPHDLESKISSFADYCTKSFDHDAAEVVAGVIAVDSEPKISGYDLVDAVRRVRDKIIMQQQSSSSSSSKLKLDVLPVTPWGKFVPALNAIVAYAANANANHHQQQPPQPPQQLQEVDRCTVVFCSAETTCSCSSMNALFSHLLDDFDNTLVVGAVLPGHDYYYYRCGKSSGQQQKQEQQQLDKGNNNNNEKDDDHDDGSGDCSTCVELNGRTCPWNTLAVWNLRKLALTGFQLVSDGLLTDDKTDPSFGVEEVVAVCLLQKLLGEDNAKAKLVRLPDVKWDTQQFDDDPGRKKWHDEKMKSKLSRAARQLELTGLSGKVYHY